MFLDALDPISTFIYNKHTLAHLAETAGAAGATAPPRQTAFAIRTTPSMDPTSKRRHNHPSKEDRISSSSLQRPTSQDPRAHLPHHKAFAPMKGANPPWVEASLQAKIMSLSINAGPSKSNPHHPTSKNQKHPQPQKPTSASMAHKPTTKPNKPVEGERKKKGDEEEKRLVLFSDGKRRSFCGPEMDVGHIVSSVGAKVVAEDMPPFMQIHAVTCARKTYDGLEKFSSKTLALTLKKEFDRVYGPAWHCIVGTSFGSFVTHSVGGFIYFAMDKLYILLFKTAVQRAE